jgi:hypothetical protein
MNISRTITVTVSHKELVEALKAAYPEVIHIQSLPDSGGSGVSVEVHGGKGVIIRAQSSIPTVEQ